MARSSISPYLLWLLPQLKVLQWKHAGAGAGGCRRWTPSLLPGTAALPLLALCWPAPSGAADVFPVDHPLHSLSTFLKSPGFQGWVSQSLLSASGWRGWSISSGRAD